MVYDRGSVKKHSVVRAAAKKILLCCALVLCAGMFVVQQYSLPTNGFVCAGLLLLFSCLFTLIFVFARKRFAVPAVLLLTALPFWYYHENAAKYLSYFLDAVIFSVNGRILKTERLMLHNMWQMDIGNPIYVKGMLLGITICAAFFAFVTAACFSGKIHVIPSILVWILFWVPALFSERLKFNVWFIPAVTLYICAIVIKLTFRNGPALSKSPQYISALRRDETRMAAQISKSSYRRRVKTRCVYYSKYYSAGAYAAAIFLLPCLIAAVLLNNSTGVDYSKLYQTVSDIGSKSGITSPFDSGPLSEYFADPEKKNTDTDSGLSITSPGTGNKEILRVTNDGTAPVYLRGDIGIDFTDNTWTSPVSKKPKEWEKQLKSAYRPVELKTLHYYAANFFGISPSSTAIDSATVSVDYLCRTNVVFLPAYTSDFGYYNNEMFDIFGDFAVRVNDNFDKMNTIRCTALVPKYANFDDSEKEAASQAFHDTLSLTEDPYYNTCYDTVTVNVNMGALDQMDNILNEYSRYVRDTYLNVPQDIESELAEYLQTSFPELYADPYDVQTQYEAAVEIADYLRDNYTYSLDNVNSSTDPVMTFLNRTKRGHCALYASAMTLLMRELGVPARYCTGFVASANGGAPQVLRSQNLHAWCEVYLGNLGWTTFDPTSSSLGGSIAPPTGTTSTTPDMSSAPPESVSVPESDSSQDTSSEISSDNSSSSKDEDSDSSYEAAPIDDSDKTNPLPYIVTILLAAAVAAAIFLAVKSYRQLKSRAEEALGLYGKTNSGDLIMEKILGILLLCGLSPKKGELPGQFFKRVEEELDCPVSTYSNALECAIFGQYSDCKALSHVLERLYRAADKKLKLLNIIKLRKLISTP